MLESIPTYRMILNPESYLPEKNPGKPIIELVCELPNSENINRKKELGFKPVESHESYYRAHLLLETKRFCREMLYNCSIEREPYEQILREGSLDNLYQVILKFQLSFFKYLILHDVKHFKLTKGHLEKELYEATSVEEIKKLLRRYTIATPLFRKVNEEYLKLKSMYC